MGTSDFPWTVEFPSGMPVVPLYPLPWRSPWDLPSSRLCRGDVPRSSTPMGSRGPWPSAPLMWPSVLLTTSAPTINRSSRGSIPSRLRIAAHHLPVYASPWSLPSTTQHAVPGAWPGLPGSGPAPDWQSRALLGARRVERTPPVFRCALYSLLLPPFGTGSVTLFHHASLCASPSQKPACGITAQASSCRPLPDGIESDHSSRPWEWMPDEVPTETLPRETAPLTPAIQPLEE